MISSIEFDCAYLRDVCAGTLCTGALAQLFQKRECNSSAARRAHTSDSALNWARASEGQKGCTLLESVRPWPVKRRAAAAAAAAAIDHDQKSAVLFQSNDRPIDLLS